VATLVVEAQADSLDLDAQIVWKDISASATLTFDGGSAQTSTTHGPKVIPPDSNFDSARYGDRPFPVVPVDYTDRAHQPVHTGDMLADKINAPEIVGSTFNLFQEMSLGQLFPNGTVPSAGVVSADFNVDWHNRYADGTMAFSNNTPQGACYGTQLGALAGTPLYAERIVDGWYQLPGDTAYYGGDKYSLGAIAGAVGGVGLLMDIDSACGPTGKAVYDAAHIADPEIDYNDYDTDKDGVVDFFMMVFPGCGGNGASQLGPVGCEIGNGVPYDNIWPHSSSLEFYFSDAATGLTGYISDDQLQSLTGVPQCWTDSSYTTSDDCAAHGGTGLDALPVFVRVGPYNVNPESAIDNASVISHEYGHSLGLPDFYSLGNRETYGDWNLMASDKSQHMDVFSKQEMGWVVPQPITQDMTIADWQDSKLDTGAIVWQQPDGTAYTLSAEHGHQNIHNAETYVVKLPARQLIDPQKVADGASLDHVWFSGSGNDFGCAPSGGHNFDIYLPELANATPGSEIVVSFKSYFDIEWDYDYGFVMATADGATYTSLESQMGYTTPASQNPNQNACQGKYGNGLTGTSGSFAVGSAAVDRLAGNYPDGGFLLDSYDLSAFAGQETVLRFSYATDPGLARPGWFIDDLTVTIDGNVIYGTDFEDHHDERLFSGGCNAHGATATTCTDGWTHVSASQGSSADHAYYLEMRDRSGFDFDGNGENDRDAIGFQPGLLLVITDESHGYGNTGADNFPAQSPVDSRPQAGNATPELNDAAFKFGDVYSDFGAGWLDNYENPAEADGNWRHAYDCLSFSVDAMTGHDTIGPNATPGDLIGTVTFDIGDGCGTFDYGY
jgi:M6 family metalloprotease-like protein